MTDSETMTKTARRPRGSVVNTVIRIVNENPTMHQGEVSKLIAQEINSTVAYAAAMYRMYVRMQRCDVKEVALDPDARKRAGRLPTKRNEAVEIINANSALNITEVSNLLANHFGIKMQTAKNLYTNLVRKGFCMIDTIVPDPAVRRGRPMGWRKAAGGVVTEVAAKAKTTKAKTTKAKTAKSIIPEGMKPVSNTKEAMDAINRARSKARAKAQSEQAVVAA